MGASAEQGAREAPWARAHFIDALPFEGAGDAGDAIEQLLIEQEVLAQRLGRRKAMPRDHLA
jgi:hypothetical protein